jgi:hypothetical protein
VVAVVVVQVLSAWLAQVQAVVLEVQAHHRLSQEPQLLEAAVVVAVLTAALWWAVQAVLVAAVLVAILLLVSQQLPIQEAAAVVVAMLQPGAMAGQALLFCLSQQQNILVYTQAHQSLVLADQTLSCNLIHQVLT